MRFDRLGPGVGVGVIETGGGAGFVGVGDCSGDSTKSLLWVGTAGDFLDGVTLRSGPCAGFGELA